MEFIARTSIFLFSSEYVIYVLYPIKDKATIIIPTTKAIKVQSFSFNVYHDLQDMIEIYKESVDIEYEDVMSKLEAYDIAFTYFKDMYRSNYITVERYTEYIEKLKVCKHNTVEKDEFIAKIKELYIGGV